MFNNYHGINDYMWNRFVDHNDVSDFVLINIAVRYKNGIVLSIREQAIFTERIKDIELILTKL